MRIISWESTQGIQLNATQQSTFSGQISPAQIEKGTTIYRFSNYGNITFGTYWTDRATVATIFEIWSQFESFSLASLKEVIQNNLAIINAFNNSFDVLIEAKVKSDTPLIGFHGSTVSQQGYDKNQKASQINQKYMSGFGEVTQLSSDHRCGGLAQIVIPEQNNRDLHSRFIFNVQRIHETSFYKAEVSSKIGWNKAHAVR